MSNNIGISDVPNIKIIFKSKKKLSTIRLLYPKRKTIDKGDEPKLSSNEEKGYYQIFSDTVGCTVGCFFFTDKIKQGK